MVYVLRSTSDCTNGGVTSKFDKFVLTGEGLPEIFEPNESSPELLLKEAFGVKYAEPADADERGMWYMTGGNFVYTSDSRYSQVVGYYPIPVRDRFE